MTKDDLISRQAAIDAIERNAYRHTYIDQIVDIIKELPSAQPEIIRCKDCRWHNGEINQCNAQVCASMYGEDFCSKGERREG